MNKNNNKKKVKNVDLETRAVRMRDINNYLSNLGIFINTFINTLLTTLSKIKISSEAPSVPISDPFVLNLPVDINRDLKVQTAISYISDLAWETHRRLGIDRTNGMYRQYNNPRWFCFGWCDNWGNGAVGYNPFSVFGIPNGTKGYLFAATDYDDGLLSENWIFNTEAVYNFNRDSKKYPLIFGWSIVIVERVGQINSFNNPDLTPFGSISSLYLNKYPDINWNDDYYTKYYLPKIIIDENLYFIEPIPSPMEFYTDLVTLVLPLNTEIDLYKLTVGYEDSSGRYNIKPGIIPDELIAKANENFIFKYSISEQSDRMGNPLPNSDPVVIINQQSGSIRLRRLGRIKVTVSHQFFQSKKYKVAYLKKTLNAGNSSGINSGGKFTIDFY
jgi:hypothetical protein